MHIPKTTIDDQIIKPLSYLLGLEISHVQSEYQERGSPGTVIKVSVFDTDQHERPFILKRVDNDRDYRLYKHYLEPYDLNSPKQYGYLELDGQRFLVMDYITHVTPNWADSNGYVEAVKWLIKKDRITSQNLDTIRSLDCIGYMEYYGIQYWLPIFEKWHKESIYNNQAKDVWSIISGNQNKINEYIDDLNEVGVQTVVHGDLHMENVLFGDNKYKEEVFVIDWTEPHIGSVTKDLASLYDNAPSAIKGELVKTYREQINFHHFDETFAKARVLRDVGYLSWMVWMINEGGKEEDYQDELDRVVKSLISSLR